METKSLTDGTGLEKSLIIIHIVFNVLVMMHLSNEKSSYLSSISNFFKIDMKELTNKRFWLVSTIVISALGLIIYSKYNDKFLPPDTKATGSEESSGSKNTAPVDNKLQYKSYEEGLKTPLESIVILTGIHFLISIFLLALYSTAGPPFPDFLVNLSKDYPSYAWGFSTVVLAFLMLQRYSKDIQYERMSHKEHNEENKGKKHSKKGHKKEENSNK